MSDLLPAKTTEGPGTLALPEGPSTLVPASPLGVFTRPTTKTGWRSWVTTIDHKKIGIMYGAAALVFFIVGGLEALLIRAQLWAPKQHLLSAEAYNQVFTMHGTTMVFLVVMPIGAAFANYLMPLQIGARDVAFPRINAFSFWCFLFAGIFLNTSWFLGGGADGGWFMYAPNSTVPFSPSNRSACWPGPAPRRGGGRGSPRSTTRRSASCTASPRWRSSSSVASRPC